MADDCEAWDGPHRVWDGRPVTGESQHTYAYRALWEDAHGPLAPGTVLHHLCENAWCVNIAHLEATTQAEHISAHRDLMRRKRKPYCPRGHLRPEGITDCPQCRAERKREKRAESGAKPRLARRRLP